MYAGCPTGDGQGSPAAQLLREQRRLAGLIVIHQDDPNPRRIGTSLASHTHVLAVIIHHPEIIVFIPQYTVERITDVSIRGELGHSRIGSIPAWRGHHLAHCCLTRPRTESFGKIFEQAEAVDDAVGLPSLSTTGATPPVLLARVQAAPS